MRCRLFGLGPSAGLVGIKKKLEQLIIKCKLMRELMKPSRITVCVACFKSVVVTVGGFTPQPTLPFKPNTSESDHTSWAFSCKAGEFHPQISRKLLRSFTLGFHGYRRRTRLIGGI